LKYKKIKIGYMTTTTKSKEEEIKELENLIKSNRTVIASFKTSIETLLKENKEAEEKIKKLESEKKTKEEEDKKIDTALQSAKNEAQEMNAEILVIQNLLKRG